MTVVGILDTLTDWVRENICTKLQLKVPPDAETGATDAGYEYKRVHPAAFALYVPAKDKLPPAVLSPFPSVCVRIVDGADDLSAKQASAKRSINVQLCFSTWDPGTHGEDVILPNPENVLEPTRWTGQEADAYFRRHGEGWRDAWNMVDVALREIERRTNVGGLVIDQTVPIQFGPLKERESIPDYYPFWFTWVSFAVTCPVHRVNEDVDKYL